jgi:hypothetical protein
MDETVKQKKLNYRVSLTAQFLVDAGCTECIPSNSKLYRKFVSPWGCVYWLSPKTGMLKANPKSESKPLVSKAVPLTAAMKEFIPMGGMKK